VKIKDFLFNNLGIKQTVFKNTLWLSLSEAITGLLGFALVIFAVRILGVTEYGKFTFAISFVSMMAIFSDLGITNMATREFSRRNENRTKFSEFLSLDLVLSFFSLFLIILGSFFITPNPQIQKIIWVLSFFVLIISFFGIFYSFFRGMQKMEYESSVRIVQAVIFFTTTLFALYYFRSAVGFAYGYFLSSIVIMILFLPFFHFFFHPIKLAWNKNVFKLLKISWPLSIGFTSTWIYINIASINLGYFNLISENGWYGASARMAIIILLPATLVVRSFYPLLSNFYINSKEKFIKAWNYLMMSMIFFTVPMAIGGITLASKIIDFFYGSAFAPSIIIFQFLIMVVVITLIGYPYNVALVISDNQKKNFFIILAGVLAHIILNIILIPLYGLNGLIISIVISSIVAFLLTVIVLKYFTNVKIPIFNMALLKDTIMVCCSGLLMFFVIRLPLVYNLNVLYIIVIGALVYSSCLLLLLKTFTNLLNEKPKIRI